MSDLKKLQRFLPVGALGISLILHLAIFLGISGIIIIQAVAPKIIPSGEYSPAGNVSDLPPAPDEPDNLQDDPTTLPEDALTDAPPIPNFGIETISAAAPTTTASFVVAPPTSMMSSSASESNPQNAPKPTSNPNKGPRTTQTMANPFGNTNANPEDGGLVGYFYDFKQTKDRKPSGLAGDPDKASQGQKMQWEANTLKEELAKDRSAKDKSAKENKIKELEKKAQELMAPEANANEAYREAIRKFVRAGWPTEPTGDFFRSEKPLTTSQFFIPRISAAEAPSAFKVSVKERRWIIVYRGAFTAPEKGQYRFVGICDDIMVVALKNKVVLDGSLSQLTGNEWPREQAGKAWAGDKSPGLYAGSWFTLEAGQNYPLNVLIGEQPGGVFYAFLLIEKKGGDYQKRIQNSGLLLPVFQLAPTNLPGKNSKYPYEPEENAPAVAKEAFICN